MTAAVPAQVVVVGAGFCGLAAAYELGSQGAHVTVLERDAEIGGLAGGFDVGGERLEKFYHHWFASDVDILQLIRELGMSDRVLLRRTRTGTYYAHDFFKLSTPWDLLRFTPLSMPNRMRLGLFALRARRLRDWRRLEEVTAADWLRQAGGERVYRVVWEPLLRGKFGDLAEEVAAVWFWNKLKLRGGSRGKVGAEQLAYYRGGFVALADTLRQTIEAQGGEIRRQAPATGLRVVDRLVQGVETPDGVVPADAVVATPALPIVADLMHEHDPDYAQRLRRIRYLANVCVVLELDSSLSDTYWLNVNDPSFPFVAVIEHTNFEPASSYAGRHIVYLSAYLPPEDPFYSMAEDEAAAFALRHLRRMFPVLTSENVYAAHVWRARYAQPVVERGYRRLIPSMQTPLDNLYLASMAQIYPQDRGTNYAVRQGRAAARTLLARLPQLGAQ